MNIQGLKPTIGADPEILIQQSGEVISCHKFLPGTKSRPFKVENGAIQVDGVAAEFNIDPASNREEFKKNLKSVMGTLEEMIGDCEFYNGVSHVFPEKFFDDLPTVNRELGCSVDYNGWTLGANPTPDSSTLMRTVGGHVHIGGFDFGKDWEWSDFELCARLARILDDVLGVASLAWDIDDERRKLYGQAGAFRIKPYGMEYRTLSNAWIFNEDLQDIVYSGVETALDILLSTDYEPPEEIPNIINNSDRTHQIYKERMPCFKRAV